MSAHVVTALIERLDSARADLRAARGGMTVAREYDVWDADENAPIRLIGNLIEVVGGEVIALWADDRIEVFRRLESFDEVYPERRLVLRRSGDSAALRAMLLPDKPRRYGLSTSELEMIRLVAEGRSNKEIGREMCQAESTVKNRMTKVLAKLGVLDRTQLAVKAIDMRLLPTYRDDVKVAA